MSSDKLPEVIHVDDLHTVMTYRGGKSLTQKENFTSILSYNRNNETFTLKLYLNQKAKKLPYKLYCIAIAPHRQFMIARNRSDNESLVIAS
ncbi:hypothetical protein F3K52_05390 [Pseudomonas lactis]|nr:hypothetical protein F3K52_05390 [Pseudomonas lactis]